MKAPAIPSPQCPIMKEVPLLLDLSLFALLSKGLKGVLQVLELSTFQSNPRSADWYFL